MASVTATKAPALPLSLQAEFADLAYAVTVQDDDAIFESVFDRSWASDVVEIGNSTSYNHGEFRAFMLNFRQSVTDRKLVSQSFIATPSDSEGMAGTVARVAHMTGVQNGKLTNYHSVAIATVVFDEEAGRRKVIRETFAVETRD